MNNPVDLIHALENEPELALLVSQPPIAFHRSFVEITGAAMPALLLSAYLEQQEAELIHADGWFEVNAAELEYRTGLSRREQAAARKVLLDKKMILERKRDFPARLEIRIDFDRISQEILMAARRRNQRNLSAGRVPGGAAMPMTWAQAH